MVYSLSNIIQCTSLILYISLPGDKFVNNALNVPKCGNNAVSKNVHPQHSFDEYHESFRNLTQCSCAVSVHGEMITYSL